MFGGWYLCIACAILFIISMILIIKSNISEVLCYVFCIVSGIATVIFFAISIGVPEEANKEIKYYTDKQGDYILYTDFLKDKNSFKLENEQRIRYYLSEINQYNNWLKEAKNSQATQGCFSAYYGKDLSGFEYIFIN